MKIVWDVACSSQTILFSTCKNIFNSLKFSQKLHLFTPFKHELVCIFHIKLEFPPFNLTILFQLGVLYRVIFCLVNLSNNTLLKIHLKHTKPWHPLWTAIHVFQLLQPSHLNGWKLIWKTTYPCLPLLSTLDCKSYGGRGCCD